MPSESSQSVASAGSDAQGRPGRGTWALLALLVVLGLAIRLHGIAFLSPHLMEPDGLVIDYQMRVLEGRGSETPDNALYAYYPHLVASVATLIPESWAAPAEPRTLAEHLASAGSVRIRGRIAVALLSLLAIPLTWWLARRFLPDPWTLLAAAFAAGSPFVVWFAQQARPHAAAASFVLLAVCAAVDLRRRGGWRAYVLAGFATGLAVGSLQNGVAALGPIGIAVLLRWRKDGVRALAGASAILAIAALFVVWLYPFLFAGAARDGVGVAEDGTLGLSRHHVFLNLFNGRGFAVVWRSLADYDPLLTGGALLGLLAAVVAPFALREKLGRERAFDLAVVLAYALPYLVVIGLYQRTYQRFVLPLLPFLAILAAFGLWAAARAAGRSWRPAGLALAAVAIVAGCAELAWGWRLGTVRARADTIQQATDWLVRNAAPGTDQVDVMPGLDLPIARTPESIAHDSFQKDEQSLPWFRRLSDPRAPRIDAPAYDLRWMPLFDDAVRLQVRTDPAAFVRSLTGRYAVVVVHPAKFRPALRFVREGLASQYERVARFSPDDPDVGEDLPLVHQDDELPYTTPWAWRILHARCVGPTVEIYRLR